MGSSLLRFGEFELDRLTFTLRRCGRRVPVQPLVFDLLSFLIEHRDRVVTREELLAHVWHGVAVSERAIPQAVMLVRRALDDDGSSPRWIATVRGRGYQFTGEVDEDSRGAGARDAEEAETAAQAAPEGLSAANPSAEGGAGLQAGAGPASAARAGDAGQALPAGDSWPLVGRAEAVEAVQEALARAERAEGGMLLLPGEPGIGKSRMLEEALVLGRAAGAQVVLGRCHGADEGAPALWPWGQVLGELVQGAEAREELAPLGVLVPALGGGGGGGADPVAQRFRLFRAAAAAIGAAGRGRPVLLAIDDLHRADEASLSLLRFVAGELASMRAVLVAAYREAGLGAERAGQLGALARMRGVRRLPLGALGLAEVAALVEAERGQQEAPERVQVLHRQTGGNPFFLLQLLRHEGGDEPLSRVDLREAVQRHLDGLRPGCRRVLEVAAVLGHEPSLAALCAVEPSAEETLDGLGEALEAGVLARVPGSLGGLRFSHALLRDALYASLPLGRRVQLHARLAEALAAQPGGADDRLGAVAYHALQAAPLGLGPMAVEFALRAAEQASRRHAYQEAARLLESALSALDFAPDPGRRAEVLHALGLARFKAGAVDAARDALERAGELARSVGDQGLVARAALAYPLEEEASNLDRRQVTFLQQGLSAAAAGDEARKALMLARLAVAQHRAADRSVPLRLAREAVGLGRASGSPAALGYALRCLHLVLLGPRTAAERSAISAEVLGLVRSLDDADLELAALSARLVDALELGDRPEVDELISAHRALSVALRQPRHEAQALRFQAMVALAEGQCAEAEALLGAAGQSGPSFAAALPWLLLRRAQGRLGHERDALRSAVQRSPERLLRRALLASALALAGEPAEAAALASALLDRALPAQPDDPEWLPSAAVLCELVAQLGEVSLAARLVPLLAPFAGRTVVLGQGVAILGPLARFQGLAAVTAGDPRGVELIAQAAAAAARWGASLHELEARLDLAERGLPHAEAALALARRLGLAHAEQRARKALSRSGG